jgi:hypothetical protein
MDNAIDRVINEQILSLVTSVYFPIVDSVINISGLCIITDSNISFPIVYYFFRHLQGNIILFWDILKKLLLH